MRERILVVDDDRDMCRLVKMYLENEGFGVDVAHSGEEALALLGFPGPSGAPDRDFSTPFSCLGRGSCPVPGLCVMIVLDIMLPGIDGFEVARQAHTRTDVPILFLTARDADVDKAVGLGTGADDYVTKPFSPMELVARVKAHLRRYRMSAIPIRSLPVLGDAHGAGLRRGEAPERERIASVQGAGNARDDDGGDTRGAGDPGIEGNMRIAGIAADAGSLGSIRGNRGPGSHESGDTAEDEERSSSGAYAYPARADEWHILRAGPVRMVRVKSSGAGDRGLGVEI